MPHLITSTNIVKQYNVKKKRRRIGEPTREILKFKQQMTMLEKIAYEFGKLPEMNTN